MRVWIATDSGTWGNAEDIRFVDVEMDENGECTLDHMTDSEICEFGLLNSVAHYAPDGTENAE